MKLETFRKDSSLDKVWIFTLNDFEHLGLPTLTESDKLLLEECGKSGKISDVLLALETIARRIEEYEAAQETK